MKPRCLFPVLLGVIASLASVRAADSAALPSPWQHQDIGAGTLAGNSTDGPTWTQTGTATFDHVTITRAGK